MADTKKNALAELAEQLNEPLEIRVGENGRVRLCDRQEASLNKAQRIIAELANFLDTLSALSRDDDKLREAAARLRKRIEFTPEMATEMCRRESDLRRRLKVAEDALTQISKDDLCNHREQAARALCDIRAEGGES